MKMKTVFLAIVIGVVSGLITNHIIKRMENGS